VTPFPWCLVAPGTTCVCLSPKNGYYCSSSLVFCCFVIGQLPSTTG
jgi:hypothetical protein